MRLRLAEISPILVLILAVALINLTSVAAEEGVKSTMADVESMKFITMMLSVGICSISAAYAVAKISVAAMASAAERPELLGRAIIFAGLAEGIAIYGLLVAVLIWIA